MAFIPVPDAVEIRVRGSMAGARKWENVFYVGGMDGAGLAQDRADEIGDAIHDAWVDSGLAALLSTLWSIQDVLVTKLATQTGDQFVSDNAALEGTNGSNSLPPQVAGVINWATATRGRSFRGRTYLNGWCEDHSNEGPDVTALAQMATFANTLRTNIAGLSFGSPFLGVVSRFSGTHLEAKSGGQLIRVPTPRVAGITTEITGQTVANLWKTQRRRNRP